MPLPRRATAVVSGVLVVVAAAGCSTANDTGPGTSSNGEAEALGHVHGIGTDPADGTVYVASHFGVFRVGDDRSIERVADRWQDTMAFTVVGAGHFLASGHPDLREDLPEQLGLIESTDAARTWDALSLQGEADFHALEVAGDRRTYGYDSVGGQLLTTKDRKQWDVIDRTPLVDLAADPGDPERLLATTVEGRLVEYRIGEQAPPVKLGGPPLLFIDWADAATLVGLASDGNVYLSDDQAATWQPTTAVSGDAQALEVTPQAWYAATSHGVFRSTDFGRRWEPLIGHAD